MTTFSLFTEGITDQAFLEIILEAIYDDTDEGVNVVSLQPPRDASDEAKQDEGAHGGWENVLLQCTMKQKISDALNLSDFVIIQIDTDCADKKNFDVSYRLEDRERTIEELIEAVKEKIISRIDFDIYNSNKDRFLFAIAVHSLECWIMPAHGSSKSSKKKIVSCEAALKSALEKSGIKYEKDYYVYQDICRDYGNKDEIKKATQHSKSFEIFIKSLPGEGLI